MAVKRIMRYLKGSLHLKLQLGGQYIQLKGYCNADWAGDVNDRRSHHELCIQPWRWSGVME
jgi:hypothetical protein